MRIFEIVLLIIVTTAVIWTQWFHQAKRKSVIILLTLASLVFLAHLLIDSLRQQMLFVYLSLFLLWIDLIINLICSRKKITKPTRSRKRILIKILSPVFLIITIALLWLFPVLTLPKPTGPYKIGTVSYELTDTGRKEMYGPNPGEGEERSDRRIRFQVWYPADSLDGGTRTKWLTDGRKIASGVPVMYGLPGFLLNHMGLIESSSYRGVRISDREISYPVVLISHGWTGFMNIHSDLAEMLASYGYIAVSINHTYGSMVTVFDDGEIVYADPGALPNRNTVDNFDTYSHALVNAFALDAQLVLDFLEVYPTSSGILEDKIDMNRVGALGHSTGGGAVVQLAVNDTKIKSVFGMDAWVEPIDQAVLEKGLQVPSSFLRSEQWETGPNNDFLRQLFAHTSVEPTMYQVNGGYHQDFSMMYMFRPITRILGFSGPLNLLENAAIQQNYVLTFFNQTLKGLDADVKQLAEKYEAVVEVQDLN